MLVQGTQSITSKLERLRLLSDVEGVYRDLWGVNMHIIVIYIYIRIRMGLIGLYRVT